MPKSKRRSVPQTTDDDKDINNYCHNGSECGRWLGDILYYTGKPFHKDFKSHMTKKDLQKKIFNIDIIPILFTE